MSGVVLASASPVRAEMLRHAGVAFEVEPASVDEAVIRESLAAEGASAGDAADALAEAKAMRISRKRPGDYVIGADQILEIHGRWLEKPGTTGNARLQLAQLSGKAHRLVSAAVLMQGGTRLWGVADTAHLTMRPLDAAAIEAYLAAAGPEVLGSVGCYQIERHGVRLFERVTGDHFTILGLPLLPLLAVLRRHDLAP